MSGLRGTITLSIACTFGLGFALGPGCASTPPANPGPGSATPRSVHTTADGLELVEELRKGTLYIKPDHGLTPHYRYYLSQVLLTYDYDSPRFSQAQEARMRQYVEDAAIGGMIQAGATMVTGPGSCVLSMGLGLVDIALTAPDATGATTSIVSSSGAITLVVDLRDSVSGEPLLRYGRRIALPGGIQWQGDRPTWNHVRQTLDELLADQRKTLRGGGVPESTVADTRCIPPDPEATPQTAKAR